MPKKNKKTVKKTTKTRAKKVAAPKVTKTYIVLKTNDLKKVEAAYNGGYRRVGTYQGGAVVVMKKQ